MASRTSRPYGSWASPLTAELIAAGSIPLRDIQLDGATPYWLEQRSTEGGRYVVVRPGPSGKPEDVTPATFDVRSRVHEYGGGAYTVRDGTVWFVHNKDQRLYVQSPGEAPKVLTPEGAWRYADIVVDMPRRRLIAVAEEHGAGPEAINRIVAVPQDGGAPVVLAEGYDFYASPRLSPDGTKLSWIAWRHPRLPWEGTELCLGHLDERGDVRDIEIVAGGDAESIFQPEWSPGGVLHFVSDRTAWWNLYRWTGKAVEPLCPAKSEFGEPQWVFGQSTYGFVDDKILCAYAESGQWRLALLTPTPRILAPVATPFTEFEHLRVSGRTAAFIGGSSRQPVSAVTLDIPTGKTTVRRRQLELTFSEELISVAEPIAFPTTGGKIAYGYFYRPTSTTNRAPENEKPPLIVVCHGGPTGATSTSLQLNFQFWTSRGFAIVDVNYGGSTGYGREYRDRLRGQWGVVDVDDCVNAARYLIARGDVDEKRCAIRGASSGGYTTLAALAFRDFFSAGANYFGVSDIEALQRDTHKFESKYDRYLVGPYPESKTLFRERSPIHHLENFKKPLIVLQGSEDKVVPPSQSEAIVNALREKGVPVAYLLFDGEQHGFRKAANIRRSLEAELYFYGRVFGFTPADAIEPVTIENL